MKTLAKVTSVEAVKTTTIEGVSGTGVEKQVNFRSLRHTSGFRHVPDGTMTGSITVAVDDDINVGDTLRLTVERVNPNRLHAGLPSEPPPAWSRD